MSYQSQSPVSRKRRLTAASSLDVVSLRRINYAWLILGMLGVLFVPALRGFDNGIGWLPFWLIAAPLINLLALQPRRLAALVPRFLVGLRQRRQAVSRRVQAKPLRRLRHANPARAPQRSMHAVLAAMLSINVRH